MNIDGRRDIINVLERLERDKIAHRDRLANAGDYDAMFPENEADQLRKAIDMILRTPVTMVEIQESVHAWANRQFPRREPSIAWMKLFEELGEVIRDPTDALEWADVFIVLFDLARIYGVRDLEQAIKDKMAINEKRTWSTSRTGVMVHVRECERCDYGDADELQACRKCGAHIGLDAHTVPPMHAQDDWTEEMQHGPFPAVHAGMKYDEHIGWAWYPMGFDKGCYRPLHTTHEGGRSHRVWEWDPDGVPF